MGRVTRAHGVRGEVAVLVLSEVQGRFEPGSRLLLQNGRTLTVRSNRAHRSRLLVRFEGIPDRTAAEPLAGEYLFVDRSEVPAAPEDAFWPHDLEGSEVVTESGRSLGRIAEIVHGEANDVWVAAEGEREILVPALKDVVASVDVAAKRVVVREIPGLIEDEA